MEIRINRQSCFKDLKLHSTEAGSEFINRQVLFTQNLRTMLCSSCATSDHYILVLGCTVLGRARLFLNYTAVLTDAILLLLQFQT